MKMKRSRRTRGSLVTTILFAIVLVAAGTWALYTLNNRADNGQDDSKDSVTTVTTEGNQAASGQTATANTESPTLYYVAIGDKGRSGIKGGCGDSIVAVEAAPVATTSPIQTALQTMLSDHDKTYGASGLYNALYLSRLMVVSADVTGDTVHADLSGTLKLAGDCDGARVQAQLEQTALTASGAKKVSITINGKPLSEAVSLK